MGIRVIPARVVVVGRKCDTGDGGTRTQIKCSSAGWVSLFQCPLLTTCVKRTLQVLGGAVWGKTRSMLMGLKG